MKSGRRKYFHSSLFTLHFFRNRICLRMHIRRRARIIRIMQSAPSYLQPYVSAALRYGAGFNTLLWASRRTQAARFDAFMRAVNFAGYSVLDAGCGRADLMDHLLERNVVPHDYIGLEAVEALATAAERKHHPHTTIFRADFVREPARLFTGSDIVLFSGSLNTLEPQQFYDTLQVAFDATAQWLVFNFLASPAIAMADFLTWHRKEDVVHYVTQLSPAVTVLDDYLAGDCTIAIRKVEGA
jgi:hypothetical protein